MHFDSTTTSIEATPSSTNESNKYFKMSDDMDVEMMDSDEDLLGDETEGSSGSLSMFIAAGTASAAAAPPGAGGRSDRGRLCQR